MNLHIKNKLPLIDLATLGTNARREVKPSVMISDTAYGPFKYGDILDGNATYNLIKQVGGENVVVEVTKDQILDILSSGDAYAIKLKDDLGGDANHYISTDIEPDSVLITNGTDGSYSKLRHNYLLLVDNSNTTYISPNAITWNGKEMSWEDIVEKEETTLNKMIALTQEEYYAINLLDENATYFIVE